MKIITKKLDFSRAAYAVSDATLKRGDNAILKSILMVADKETQKVTLRATDTMIEITTTFDCRIIDDGTCCFDIFVAEVIQNLKEDDVTLTLNNGVLNVTCGESTHDFNVIDAERFPIKQEIKNYKILANLADLLKGIELCSTCVDVNATDDYARTYKIDFPTGKIITTDRKKVSIFNLPWNDEGVTIIPGRMLDFIIPKLRGLETIQISIGDWCGFKNEEFEIAVNTLKLNYPDVVSIVNREKLNIPKFELIVKIAELRRILNLCKLYEKQATQNNQDSYTILRMCNGEMTISVDIENFSRMKEPFEVTIQNSQVTEYEIWFNSSQLDRLVQVITAEVIKFQFFENNKAFFVYPEGLENFIYLQMPYIKSNMGK